MALARDLTGHLYCDVCNLFLTPEDVEFALCFKCGAPLEVPSPRAGVQSPPTAGIITRGANVYLLLLAGPGPWPGASVNRATLTAAAWLEANRRPEGVEPHAPGWSGRRGTDIYRGAPVGIRRPVSGGGDTGVCESTKRR